MATDTQIYLYIMVMLEYIGCVSKYGIPMYMYTSKNDHVDKENIRHIYIFKTVDLEIPSGYLT